MNTEYLYYYLTVKLEDGEESIFNAVSDNLEQLEKIQVLLAKNAKDLGFEDSLIILNKRSPKSRDEDAIIKIVDTHKPVTSVHTAVREI